MSRKMAPVDEQLFVLMSGVDYGDPQLKRTFEAQLKQLLEEDRPLRVYLGIDPTATSLTLGHTVPLRKLRQFQQFGHHAIFLIGDYTALIGDPSDKNKLRPMLTPEDIKANEATYFVQAARILEQQETELRHNSEWLSKLAFEDIISLMSKFTVAEMLRRENFRNRFDAAEAIYLHEFLYALMQGYDAMALECDAQVGGTEQLFNLMAGRKLQEDAGQRPHVPVTLPILVGLDGKERMSKSKGNHIGVDDPPEQQYGKAMSLPDEVIGDFFTLATNMDRAEVARIIEGLAAGKLNPMEEKKRLARTIATEFWGEEAAREAEATFERTVQRKEAPTDADYQICDFQQNETYADLLVRAGLVGSKRGAVRLIQGGGLRRFEGLGEQLFGTLMLPPQVTDPSEQVRKGDQLRVGKRAYLRVE